MRRLSRLFAVRRPWKSFETSVALTTPSEQGNSISVDFVCDDAIGEQVERIVMSRRSWSMVHLIFMLFWLTLMSLTEAYPVESKPLNNNPDTWNFGDGWLTFNPRNSADPSASALIGNDPHIKKSKITPKSIFIAPNSWPTVCPHGFRIDDNGKCIKTVTINQDELLAARISELFGIDESPSNNKNSDIDSDYYDFDDESKADKDAGPLQFTLPLAIDIEEVEDGKRVEYVIEDKIFTMRNLRPEEPTTVKFVEPTTVKLVEPTTVIIEEPTTFKVEESTTVIVVIPTTIKSEESTSSAPVTETTEPVSTDEPTTSSIAAIDNEEKISTTTETILSVESSIVSVTENLPVDSTIKNDEEVNTTVEPTTTTTTTTTQKPTTVKIFSVDFLPNSKRKSNRNGQASARLQNSRDRDKAVRPRKQKTTAVSTKSNEKLMTKLYKIEGEKTPKKNRTRNGSKRPGNRKTTTTTTEATTEEFPAVTQKPFWWLPKGWSIDETKEKPVLVRFWAKQPLQQDERARSHNSRQRVNSRMPTDNIFQEVTGSEISTVLQK